MLLEGSAFAGSMSYKLMVGAVPWVMNQTYRLGTSGWPNISSPKEKFVEGLNFGLPKGIDRWGFPLVPRGEPLRLTCAGFEWQCLPRARGNPCLGTGFTRVEKRATGFDTPSDPI